MGGTEPDPFAIFHTPPPNETPGEREAREAKEAEDKRISDEIDEQLRMEKALLKKQRNMIKVLLLGQSESGKSTTLKNFRMKYAHEDWEAERASWRAVIQLNLVRSIITIVETIQAEMDGDPLEAPMTPATPLTPGTPSSAFPDSPTEPLSALGGSPTLATSFAQPRPSIDASSSLAHRSNSLSKAPLSSLLTDKHQLLKLRLGPLRRVEADLKRRLGAGADEEPDGIAANLGVLDTETTTFRKVPKREFSVRRLKEALENGTDVVNSRKERSRSGHSSEGSSSGVDEATEIIASCKDDMLALWTDEAVRIILKRRKVRMEDGSGFFLDDLERIATQQYEPSDDDVLRARLRTVGVQEYKIQFDPSMQQFSGGLGDFGREWLLYDVGGSRTMRHAWLPFFEGIHAVLFLAPVSCFDERLLEDSKVNRLEDSFLLWRSICSSKLLSKTSMILFLNKCDLLKRKLKAGVKVKNYLPSYGDRNNDMTTVVKYLREKFREILKQFSPEARSSYFYATSVIDTKATASTIKAVKDSILRDFLKSADLV